MLTLFAHAGSYGNKTAIISGGRHHSYENLLDASARYAALLCGPVPDLHEAPVAFMVDPGFEYVAVQWGIWRAGGVAVPLCLTHPLPALQYVLEDTGASTVIVSKQYKALLQEYAAQHGIRLVVTGTEAGTAINDLPEIATSRAAMILYTSGTTNKPKGVVSTHANLHAQISTLVDAWQWSASDHTLCVLPVHHVHGIVNVVSCALWSGAVCEFLPAFSAEELFAIFELGAVNVFMAVPTIYYKLIAYWKDLPVQRQQALKACMQRFRLMVCGSAALPVSVMEEWKAISGHTLLERYGMTEIGMAISNPYTGERKAGYVGLPLPGVQVKIADEQYRDVPDGMPGEILVKGENVFKEYWNKPEATAREFTPDGWFKTGDIAVVEDGYYRIMGRSSVDIIKSGGYKISALEIEEVLRTHPQVADCAVAGVPDDEWGELIVCALVAKDAPPDTDALNSWLRERMAAYKTPRRYLVLPDLPRNAMGKVVKNEVKKLFIQ